MNVIISFRIPSWISHYTQSCPLVYNSASSLPCFWWPWWPWGVLVMYLIECPSVWVPDVFLSHDETEVVYFGGHCLRSKVSFSTHCIRSTCYQQSYQVAKDSLIPWLKWCQISSLQNYLSLHFLNSFLWSWVPKYSPCSNPIPYVCNWVYLMQGL